MTKQAQTLASLSAQLAAGSISAVELADASLSAIAATDGILNAVITATPDLAMAQATAADQLRAQGKAGPLTGIPLAHKDIFCTKGIRTSCGSRMLDNFDAPYDATVVERLQAAGMVTVAKANMDEFAMGSSTEHSHYGPACNPWDPARSPGGSSGGSAALVASGVVPVATGTDTGGSIRQPAAFTGTTGLKPTYGRVSRWGMVAFASSLDQGGCFAHSAEDIALVLSAMAGFDPKDSTSAGQPVPDYHANLALPAGLRLGIPVEYCAGLAPEAQSALDAVRRLLEARGCSVVDVHLPHTAVTVPTYYVIAPAEASANLSRYDGVRFGHRCADPKDLTDLYMRSRDEAFGAEVKRRILTGTYVLSVGYYDAYYVQAQKVRRLIRDELVACFDQVDALLTPTTPGPAFVQGSIGGDDPTAMYQQDIYTLGASLAGLPAMSLPAGFTDSGGSTLPLGAQLIGPHFSEARLLALAHAVQQDSNWHLQLPPIHAGDLA